MLWNICLNFFRFFGLISGGLEDWCVNETLAFWCIQQSAKCQSTKYSMRSSSLCREGGNLMWSNLKCKIFPKFSMRYSNPKGRVGIGRYVHLLKSKKILKFSSGEYLRVKCRFLTTPSSQSGFCTCITDSLLCGDKSVLCVSTWKGRVSWYRSKDPLLSGDVIFSLTTHHAS